MYAPYRRNFNPFRNKYPYTISSFFHFIICPVFCRRYLHYFFKRRGKFALIFVAQNFRNLSHRHCALAKHIGDENAWVAIYCGDESYVDNTNNLGMYINYDVNSSKTPEEYFVSMIKYMQDNNKFAEMWIDGGIDTVLDVSKTLDYIDANGLKSYGIAVYTDRDTLLNLMENPNIFRIMPDRGRFDDIAYRS